ncbi:MAG: MarR family transcriptional regulator [Bacteroidia bacterium]|nr:MarR family transcriptional regulator [Bacteroidia bacterium]
MSTVEIAPIDSSFAQLEKAFFLLSEVNRKHHEYIKAKYKINGLEMEIIQLIELEGRKKMKEIGQYFNVKLSTLTSIIDKIEKQRLVKRVNSSSDRRVVFLEVTKKGQKLYQDYQEHVKAISTLIQNEMEETQIQSLVNGLSTMSQFVEGQTAG